MQPRDVDEIRARLVEVQRLRYVLRGQHDLRLRASRPNVAQQSQVAGASEDVVGDARNDELRVLDAHVPQGVCVSHIAIDAADPALAELTHHGRVEIDDQDLGEKFLDLQRFTVMLELVQDGAGVAEEAQEDDRLVP